MSAGARPWSPPRTFGWLLDEVTASGGDRPAVFYEGATTTYTELRHLARRFAKGLVAMGLRRGDRVATLFANQPEWLVTCLGATYVGCVLVPLNTWYKARELEWTLRHCGVSVLVAIPRFLKQDYARMLAEFLPGLTRSASGDLGASRLPELRAVVFAGDGPAGTLNLSDLLHAGSAVTDAVLDAARDAVRPEDGAYILYTSGSTAEPKGVLLNHGGLVDSGVHIGDRRLINDEDRIWLGSPLFYGLGAANAFPVALSHGASLVLHDYFEAGRAIQAIRHTAATVYYGTGNMSQAILDHPDFERRKVESLQKGNAGTVTQYKQLTLVDLGIRLATPAYGLTESYGHATGGFPEDALEVKLHTDGTPLTGVEVAIVDPDSYRPLKAGARGLILLRGRTTPGYFASPHETAGALRPDGYFDTGDLGHLDGEGRLVFHSRLKEVIKRGGISVSPLEIEHLLTTHPNIRDAVVVGVAHPGRGELIVAYVDATVALDEQEVRDFVRERGASFNVPDHVFFRHQAQLPRLASGKIAKHVLSAEARRQLEAH